jgi:hypothetical protein
MVSRIAYTRRRLMLGIFAGCLLVFIAVLICFSMRLFDKAHPDLSTIASVTGVRFPTSAYLLRSEQDWWENIWAKVEIDNMDVAAFITSIPAPRELSSVNRFSMVNNLGFLQAVVATGSNNQIYCC